MMTTTYHPATNRYAAIVEAVRTPPPPRPRLHLARISLSVPPLAADDAPELARWQVDLLRYMADHGPVSAADLARHFGYASASNVSATISPLRRALVALTGDPDARHVIVTTHGCGYDLDRDAAGRYPVVVAALEGCVP